MLGSVLLSLCQLIILPASNEKESKSCYMLMLCLVHWSFFSNRLKQGKRWVILFYEYILLWDMFNLDISGWNIFFSVLKNEPNLVVKSSPFSIRSSVVVESDTSCFGPGWSEHGDGWMVSQNTVDVEEVVGEESWDSGQEHPLQHPHFFIISCFSSTVD